MDKIFFSLLVLYVIFEIFRLRKDVTLLKNQLNKLISPSINKIGETIQDIVIPEKLEDAVDMHREILPQRESQIPYNEKAHINIDPPLFSWIKENWTIAIGAVFLSAGILSFAVYLSIYLGNMFRVIILLSLSSLFFGSAHRIGNFFKSDNTKHWFLSIGSTVLFLAAVGSSYTAELKIIEDASYKILPIVFALILNMFVAIKYKKSFLPAYIVFISSFVLSYILYSGEIAEVDKYSIFLLGTVSSLFSIISFKTVDKILSIIFFTIFNYFWIKTFCMSSIIPQFNIACILFLALFSLGTYYFNTFKNKQKLEWSSLLHITSWICLFANLFPYRMGNPYLYVLIFGLGLIVLALSFYARSKNERELFYCDWVVAQLLISVSFGMFCDITNVVSQSNLSLFILLVSCLLLCSNFYLNRIQEHKILNVTSLLSLISTFLMFIIPFLQRESIYLSYFGYVAAAIMSLDLFSKVKFEEHDHYKKCRDASFWMAIFSVLLRCFMHTTEQTSTLTKLTPLIMVSIFVAPLFLNKNSLIERNRLTRPFSILSIFLCIVISKYYAIYDYGQFFNNPSLFLIPMLLLFVNFKQFSFNGFSIGMSLSTLIYCATLIYFLLSPIHLLLPSFFCLFLSYGCLEIRNIKSDLAKIFIPIGILSYIGFYIFHCLIDLHTPGLLFDQMSFRFIFSIIGLLLGFLWIKDFKNFEKLDINLKYYKLFNELFLSLLLLTVFIEVIYPWQPFCYALISLLIGYLMSVSAFPKRGVYYIAGILLSASVSIIGINRFYQSPLSEWYYQAVIPSILGFLALVIPSIINAKNLHNRMKQKYWHLMNILPVFISMAFFLYDRLSKTYISISWVLLSILLALIAFYLKARIFLQIAYTGILYCIAKVILFDVSHFGFLERSTILLVFGVLMIFIHLVYKKFDYRLSEESTKDNV